MKLLDEIGNSIFRARDLETYAPGQTLPPVNRSKAQVADVHHLNKFEDLANDHMKALRDIDQNRADMIELERSAGEARRAIDEEKKQLKFRLSTLEDQINQHIELVYPNAKLVHHVPPPPDPSTLDVVVEPPPLKTENKAIEGEVE